MPERLQDPEGPVVTRRARPQTKPLLGLFVRNTFAAIQLCEPSLDLGEKHQAPDSIVNGCIRREFPQRLNHAVARI